MSDDKIVSLADRRAEAEKEDQDHMLALLDDFKESVKAGKVGGITIITISPNEQDTLVGVSGGASMSMVGACYYAAQAALDTTTTRSRNAGEEFDDD